MTRRPAATVDGVDAAAYVIPTDEPESDGTIAWDSTTIVVVHVRAGRSTGMGYTYGDRSIVEFVRSELAGVVEGSDPFDVGRTWNEMGAAIRNAGRPGVGMMAIAAIDVALWDLEARLLDVALVDLLPAYRDEVAVYGSGGFTSYTLERIEAQLGGWVDDGIPRVKMKVGRRPADDPARLDTARKAIGDAALFVDANGAFDRKQALAWAHRYRGEWDVVWFEEPVTSADFEGLRLVRDRGPGGLDVAAGEYAYVLTDFTNLVTNGCVDCLQVDATRAGGITGVQQAAGLAAGHHVEVSGHCAPNLSAHALCGLPGVRHLEYFHDHVRIERLLFDGALEPVGGALRPDRDRPGHGLVLKQADAEPYRVA